MSDPVEVLVDTNILLRFLMNDHLEHGKRAKGLIERAGAGKVTLFVPFITIVETLFTLQSFYQIQKESIGLQLLKVLSAPGIKIGADAWILEAIDEYRTRNVSFGDACLAAEARHKNLPIASFDRGIDKFPGIVRFEPK
jgi:predicted nucleic-acid-binding protein